MTENQNSNKHKLMQSLAAMIAADVESAPYLYEHDRAHWQRFLGGEIEMATHPAYWPSALQALAQPTRIIPVATDDVIQALWHGDEQASARWEAALAQGWARPGSKFFKVQHRTTKDAMCMIAREARELIEICEVSERAMEEIAIAHAQGQEQILFVLRDEIKSPSLDRTELRVLIADNELRLVSTGPYAHHTEQMARQLLASALPTLQCIAQHMHVSAPAWCDAFHLDGAWLLCDINTALPTTWPGHFAAWSDADVYTRSGQLAFQDFPSADHPSGLIRLVDGAF